MPASCITTDFHFDESEAKAYENTRGVTESTTSSPCKYTAAQHTDLLMFYKTLMLVSLFDLVLNVFLDD